MTVILVTQDIGVFADELAAELAKSFGFGFVSQDRIEQRIAKRMHINQDTVHRLLEGRARVIERWIVRPQRLARHMAAEIAELIPRGDAVVQSCGETTLWRLVPHVICVHVCGGTGAACRRSRSSRADAMRWLSAANRAGREPYDLVLDAERLTIDECTQRIRRLAQRAKAQPTPPPPQILERVARQTYRHSLPTLHAGAEDTAPPMRPILEVEVAGETLRLLAGSSHEEAIACIEQHLLRKGHSAVASAHGYLPLTNSSFP
jgi:hypothetical protein